MQTIPILVLRLEGLLQSWGEHSKWNYRDSAPMPTKSGVVGMIGCAMGWERDDDRLKTISDNLQMAVRADRPGREIVDFHTVQSREFLNAQGKHLGKKGEYYTIITYRTYLQDAFFTVALSGDVQCLREIADAFLHPKWPVYLGRKSCVPSRPVLDKITEEYGSLAEAIRAIPFEDDVRRKHRKVENRVMIEMDNTVQEEADGSRIERADRIDGARKFRSRTVVRQTMERSEANDTQ